MNLFDSSFLCLDIGSVSVRAMAHRVRNGKIIQSAIYSIESSDTVFAVKSVVDELEKQLGTRFDSAYITGNFGPAEFKMIAKSTRWTSEHKITTGDIRSQIGQIATTENFYPMHIIPLHYDTSVARNLLSPVGYTDRQLMSVFGSIFYSKDCIQNIFSRLRKAHIQTESFFDPSFLQNMLFRDKKQTGLFIDLGNEFTTVSVWTDRGPVFFEKIPIGQNTITMAIANNLNVTPENADRIKRLVVNIKNSEMDRFTPADSAYDFSRADVNEIALPILMDIISNVHDLTEPVLAKRPVSKIFISGGGSNIDGITESFEEVLKIPVKNLGIDASVHALSAYIWNEQSPRINAYLARRAKWKNLVTNITSIFKRQKKKKIRTVPIMPSTLVFNMKQADTYSLFRSGNISMIHVDIMDGFFVDRIAGGIEELKYISEHTDAHLHVHLMTESPVVWATAAANAGAHTIIVSTNTAGVRAALRRIREMGKRCGVALNLESPTSILRPVLKEIDEVMIMTIKPGAAGQEFDESALNKISVLNNTRKKYGLNFKISVDGGINPETAQLCWNAGADFLVSGSYLARNSDFPMAVQSLMKHE